jgi:hypothetical protein
MKSKLRLLSILITMSSCFIFKACQNDIGISEIYFFNNQTNYELRILSISQIPSDSISKISEVFKIRPNSTLAYETGWGLLVSHRREATPFSHFPHQPFHQDTIVVLFNGIKMLSYSLPLTSFEYCSLPNHLYCSDSYKVRYVNKFQYEYTYRFTEEDHDNASDINYKFISDE